MSYRVANVRFSMGDEQIYPVNCNRADLKPGQKVVVETPRQQKRFKLAIVESVEFKNWDCENTILCLHSEVIREADGGWSFKARHSDNGQIHQVCDLEDRLVSRGWSRTFPQRRATYKVVFALQTSNGEAEIRLRKNGIDFRMPGRRVNHWFHESEIDLLEFSWSFAEQWRMESIDLNITSRHGGGPILDLPNPVMDLTIFTAPSLEGQAKPHT